MHRRCSNAKTPIEGNFNAMELLWSMMIRGHEFHVLIRRSSKVLWCIAAELVTVRLSHDQQRFPHLHVLQFIEGRKSLKEAVRQGAKVVDVDVSSCRGKRKRAGCGAFVRALAVSRSLCHRGMTGERVTTIRTFYFLREFPGRI